eukprot:SAG31_NODE_3083_length_4696_cov_3.351751_5_plen_269_part_00
MLLNVGRSATQDSQTYGAGLMNGQTWAPAEADTCIRTATCCAPGGEPSASGSAGCWVWYPNTSSSVKSLATLKNSYLTTVGRNSNLLLNISPNTDGTIDSVDMQAYRQLGDWIHEKFDRALTEKNDIVLDLNTTTIELAGASSNFSYIVVMEEQQSGQHIWGWTVEGRREKSAHWDLLAMGGSIGHKRIISCAELHIGETTGLVKTRTTERGGDPPAPPPQPDDVVFTNCVHATNWSLMSDGTIRGANSSAEEEVTFMWLLSDSPSCL